MTFFHKKKSEGLRVSSKPCAPPEVQLLKQKTISTDRWSWSVPELNGLQKKEDKPSILLAFGAGRTVGEVLAEALHTGVPRS